MCMQDLHGRNVGQVKVYMKQETYSLQRQKTVEVATTNT